MLRTVQSFQYQNYKKRQITFSLSQLLRRKTVPSPEDIMNTKMTRQRLPIQKTIRMSNKPKISQSYSCRRSAPKINYQILRTKTYTRIKSYSQPKINPSIKVQSKSQQKPFPHTNININKPLKYSKVDVKERTFNPKFQKAKSFKQQTKSTIFDRLIQNFGSLKSSFNLQNMVFKQTLDLGYRKQFLKKGSSLQKHILNNLVKSKVLQQNLSLQKPQYMEHQIQNLSKFFKEFRSSIYSAQFCDKKPTKINQKSELEKYDLQNKSVKRLKTHHNFEYQKLQKQKQLVGWQLSPEIQFSILKDQSNNDSIIDSSPNSAQQKNNDFLRRKKIKTLNQKKKSNAKLLKN